MTIDWPQKEFGETLRSWKPRSIDERRIVLRQRIGRLLMTIDWAMVHVIHGDDRASQLPGV